MIWKLPLYSSCRSACQNMPKMQTTPDFSTRAYRGYHTASKACERVRLNHSLAFVQYHNMQKFHLLLIFANWGQLRKLRKSVAGENLCIYSSWTKLYNRQRCDVFPAGFPQTVDQTEIDGRNSTQRFDVFPAAFPQTVDQTENSWTKLNTDKDVMCCLPGFLR